MIRNSKPSSGLRSFANCALGHVFEPISHSPMFDRRCGKWSIALKESGRSMFLGFGLIEGAFD
jgi:hypothetical protein